MVESLVVTVLPALFLIVLFGGGGLLRRKKIDQDGAPPINKALFLSSKYLVVVLWVAAVVQAWGANLAFIEAPALAHWISLVLWVAGFALLFIGRLGLGNSFRIGSPKEQTRLQVDGLFTFSRNPMYLGVYTTLIASTLFTMNPILLALAIFVIAVHHRIVLAEEQYLRSVFGQEYLDYCCRVRRYL